MNGNIFQKVKDGLHPRLETILPELLPGGKIVGREYVCASLQGGPGTSCFTNLDTGVGSDSATGDRWKDVIALWAKRQNIRQGKAAEELAERYGIVFNAPVASKALHPVAVESSGSAALSVPGSSESEAEDISIKEWPELSFDACPGIVGEFVRLATRDSEADPAAVCGTMLTRFAAEVYGHAEGNGPHMYIGETLHMPRLFAVICGGTSKARKGTSLSPVKRLFSRKYCLASEISDLKLPLPARESGGPLSTGEGLACQVKDETEEEREHRRKENPDEPLRNSGDKRLMILDEEFASALACTKREGNTLSMGLRCFWDSGDYSPLTKSNPVRVKNAHICIITHITMEELAVALANVQAFNGFGNRFLWICAHRSKLVASPEPMPVKSIAPLQNELWRLVSHAQQCGLVTMTPGAREQWEYVYPELSKEHRGLAGSIINRAEAQAMRLALVYALLDGQSEIQEKHLKAALAMWSYAQESALLIFGDKASDPLEDKIWEALKQKPHTTTELYAIFNRNISKGRLRPVLQRMVTQQRISVTYVKAHDKKRPTQIFSMREITAINESNEFDEKKEAIC